MEFGTEMTGARMSPFRERADIPWEICKNKTSSLRPQKVKILNSLKIKSLTNVLPRFNVHLFLTRGTYSIKISY